MFEIDGSINRGLFNELLIIDEINGKLVKNTNLLFQELFYSFFKNIKNTDRVKAYKGKKYEKTDIIVEINNQRMNISVKIGIKNSVHCERINSFIIFLKSLGIPFNAINEYLLYHYADGTKNGTGQHRISVMDYKKNRMDKVDMINSYFNNKKYIDLIADRFIFKGTQKENSLVDVILWGKPNDFLYVFRDETIDYLETSFIKYSTGTHFGRLAVQPSNRCLNRNPKQEFARNQVEIKWYNIFDSMLEIIYNRVCKNSTKDFLEYWNSLENKIINNEFI